MVDQNKTYDALFSRIPRRELILVVALNRVHQLDKQLCRESVTKNILMTKS
jgi:hypothetical protein